MVNAACAPQSPVLLADPEHSRLPSCTWIGLQGTPITPLPFVIDEPKEGREVGQNPSTSHTSVWNVNGLYIRTSTSNG